MNDQREKTEFINIEHGIAVSEKILTLARQGNIGGVYDLLVKRRILIEQLFAQHHNYTECGYLRQGLEIMLDYDTRLRELLNNQKVLLEKEIHKNTLQQNAYRRYAVRNYTQHSRCIDKKV